MSYTTSDPSIGYASGSETSYQGAQATLEWGTALAQERQYVSLLRQHGRLTDHEAARLMGLPASRVSARRGGLNKKYVGPLVVQAGKKNGPHGVPNTCWALVE